MPKVSRFFRRSDGVSSRNGATATPDCDESARILAGHIGRGEPCSYWRLGDGAIECIRYATGDRKIGADRTCDGEQYTPELAERLKRAIAIVRDTDAPNKYLGDWRTADGGSKPRYLGAWQDLVSVKRQNLLHYEALLLMRESEGLSRFWRTVFESDAPTAYIGSGMPEALANRWFIARSEKFSKMLILPAAPRLILFGGGMHGFCDVAEYWAKHPEVTCVHIGSGLDNLTKITRNGQLPVAQARAFMERL
jgi:hypothetical protein